jgi:hypothetical protein
MAAKTESPINREQGTRNKSILIIFFTLHHHFNVTIKKIKNKSIKNTKILPFKNLNILKIIDSKNQACAGFFILLNLGSAAG